jgi:hypothetical protein
MNCKEYALRLVALIVVVALASGCVRLQPTPTVTPTSTPLPTATPSSTPAPSPPATIVLTVRDEVLTDAWITPDEPDANFSYWGRVHLQGALTPDRLLYQPDLTSIPAGVNVQAATLEIYAAEDLAGIAASVAAYRLLRPWDVATATYVHPWSAPGLKAETDFAAQPLDWTGLSAAGWFTLDVTTAVQGWVSGQANYGLMLRIPAQSAADFSVFTSDNDDLTLRPRLTITATTGPLPSTPTPSPTPTPAVTSGLAYAWAVGDGEKIRRDKLNSPLKAANDAWVGQRIRLFSARNEVVAFQLILEAGPAGAFDVNVTVSDLVSGTQRIANDFSLADAYALDLTNSVGRRIELFREHYVPVTTPSRGLYVASPDKLNGPGWYPDALIPLEVGKARGGAPFDIPAHSNQGVWVDIYVPRDTPAGEYTGAVLITEHNGLLPQAIPIVLTVYDFTLPDETHLRTLAYLADPWRLVEHHGLDNPGSDAYYTVEAAYARMAHRHRIDLVTERELDWVRYESDHEAAYLRGTPFIPARGYEGPGEGLGQQVFLLQISKTNTRQNLAASVEGWYGWFEDNGLDWGRALWYIMDEPDVDDYPWIRERAAWNHALAHPARVFLTEAITDTLAGAVDVWCPPASEGPDGLDVDAAAAQQAAGREVGAYNGHRPGAGTLLIDDDAVAPRTWAWIAFKHGLDLWYVWDVAYWRDVQGDGHQSDVWNDAVTFDRSAVDWQDLGNGDGVLFYPGEDALFPAGDRGIPGPVASIRLKAWRRGLQDYEYLWLARQAGYEAEVEAIVRGRVPAVLSEASGLATKTWSSRSSDWERARRTLADLIVTRR